MAFKTGDKVKFVTPVIEGEVVGATVDAQATLLLLIAYTDAQGLPQERYFEADQLSPA